MFLGPHGMKVRAAGPWLWDISQLEQELAHVLPLSCLVRSDTLFVFPSNAKVNDVEVCPSGGGRGVCPDLLEVRCVAVVEGPEYLCSSDGWI